VMDHAQERLNRLFFELYQLPKFDHARSIMGFCDQLALHCLKITGILIGSQSLGIAIAKDLSLILETEKEPSAEDEIRGSIMAVEEGLEANLRGFSGLLNWILQEDMIRRDPMINLRNVPNLDRSIVDLFRQLALAIEAYIELDNAFTLKTPQVAVIIFLTTLSDTYSAFLDDAEKGPLAISEWLTGRVKSDNLKDLFEASLKRRDLPICSLMYIGQPKELLILDICFRVTQPKLVRSDEAALLDKALSSLGMPGLKPLLDSGFLILENDSLYEDLIGNNTPKILRIK
jgi:hypothetical protein